jgi:hypothetical protein
MSAILKGAAMGAMLALSTVTGAAVSAASESATIAFKPLHGVSLHLGSKHAIGYFQAENGVCQLTLVVGEEIKGDEVLTQTPARFCGAVAAGQNVRFDAGEGHEVQFHCTAGAATMSVETLQQVAYTPRHGR